jgi:hypothetical protein
MSKTAEPSTFAGFSTRGIGLLMSFHSHAVVSLGFSGLIFPSGSEDLLLSQVYLMLSPPGACRLALIHTEQGN